MLAELHSLKLYLDRKGSRQQEMQKVFDFRE